MLRSIAFFVSLCLLSSISAQITISEARGQSVGSSITVTGTVTNGSELGGIRYFQDATGGLAAFPGGGSAPGFDAVVEGDSIIVSGTLVLFNGLLEINPVTSYSIISTGNDPPEPITITISELGKDNESQLVNIKCLRFLNEGSFTGSTLYPLIDLNGDETALWVHSNHQIIGDNIPDEVIEITAISAVFNNPQLVIRSANDFLQSSCFSIVSGPEQKNITTNGFTIEWETNLPSTSSLEIEGYYFTDMDLTVLTNEQMNTRHSYDLSTLNLEPAGFYSVRVGASTETEDASSSWSIYATASLSTGEIEVYFNKPVKTSFSNGAMASGDSWPELEQAIIDLINDAQQTIDYCALNNNRTSIVNALIDAHNSGVQVRAVVDEGSNNDALMNVPFPVLSVNDRDLMHNKFIVADAHFTELATVMTGSTNFSINQIQSDPNHIVFLQDETLAKNYTIEFEEMWGSQSGQPDMNMSLSGNLKTDNTAHLFLVGGSFIENYFSPTDKTTSRIIDAILSADHHLEIALLVFTRDDILAAILDRIEAGVNVRGIIEDANASNFEITSMNAEGGNVFTDEASSIFHHKYAIIDEGTDSAPRVITGSHNWSNRAENNHDENLLIIHDADIANIFYQEFQARWEAFPSFIEESVNGKGIAVFPNPALDVVHIHLEESLNKNAKLLVFDPLGQLVILKKDFDSGRFIELNIDDLAAGSYFLLLINERSFSHMSKIIVGPK